MLLDCSFCLSSHQFLLGNTASVHSVNSECLHEWFHPFSPFQERDTSSAPVFEGNEKFDWEECFFVFFPESEERLCESGSITKTVASEAMVSECQKALLNTTQKPNWWFMKKKDLKIKGKKHKEKLCQWGSRSWNTKRNDETQIFTHMHGLMLAD